MLGKLSEEIYPMVGKDNHHGAVAKDIATSYCSPIIHTKRNVKSRNFSYKW